MTTFHDAPDKLKKRKVLQWKILAASLLVLGSFIGYNLYKVRNHTIEQEKQRILTQARVIARNMGYQFSTANQALQGILDDMPLLQNPKNHESANARLAILAQAMPDIRTVFLTDLSGTVISASRKELIGKNFAFRDYFQQALKNHDPNTLYISPPFKTVLGTYTFNITRMIAGPDGSFTGIATAGIEAEYFDVLLNSVLYAPDMIVTINHGDGIRFKILPAREGQVGMNIAVPGSMFTRHKQSGRDENVYIDTGFATKEYRMTALVTLNRQHPPMDKPPCIIVGRKMTDVMASWRNYVIVQGLFFLLVCIVSIAALRLAQRREAETFLAEQELAESRQRFENIFDFMPDATLAVDMEKRVIAWNRAMEVMSDVPKEQMIGKGNYEYTIPFYGERRPNLIDALFSDDDRVRELYHGVSRQGGAVYAETFCPALYNGRGAHIWAVAAPLYDTHGVMTGAIGSVRDISTAKKLEAELKQKNELLASQARLDFLTGIYNRLMFSELLHAEFAGACRYDMPLAMMMFDIDYFKRINDTLGHKTGDHVLKEIARLVSDRLRSPDIFCRWGGEEFLVLLPNIETAQATQLAEILREMIDTHDFGDGLHVTVSFGVVARDCKETPEALIERADAALYKAKNSGRNRVVTG